jgi:phosphatidylserine decarboxylase
MIFSYLERKIHFYFIFFILATFFFRFYLVAFVAAIFYGILIYVYRKEHKDFLESQHSTEGVVLSPVNGVVQSVRSSVDHEIFGNSCLEILISIPWWKEWGIRMPVTGEVVDSQEIKNKSYFRYFSLQDGDSTTVNSGTFYTFLTPKGEKIGLQFLPCPLGLSPQIVLMPGDRGSRVANMGFFPFGGSVLIFLSQNYEIMVNIGDQITSGETPLAGEQT